MYFKGIEETLKELNSDRKGLTYEEVKKRLNQYGLNILEEKEENKLKIFVKQFLNPLVIILILASLIALFLKEYKDAFVILAVITANSLIGFYQEIKALRSIKALKSLTAPKAKVIREGNLIEIDPQFLVPGDIVVLQEGDVIPADIRIIEDKGLLVNEAILTGESLPVEKEAKIVLPENTPIYGRKNVLFKGTSIYKGKTLGVVFATGKNTELGKIIEKIKEESPQSPLTKALSIFAKKWIIILLITLIILLLLGWYQGRSLKELFFFVIALLVSAVPEGLPIAITIALVIGAIKLAKRYVLIRELPAVETLGSATYICSDKTGTITEGNLKVKEVFILNKEKLYNCAILCNDSDGQKGDPLEVALLNWVEREKIDWRELRNKNEIIFEIPFDVHKRYMGVVVKNKEKKEVEFYIKGAFEILKKKAKNKEGIEKLQEIHDTFAEKGLRVLGFGYAKIEEFINLSEEGLENLPVEIVGLIGFMDPPKKGVKEAIKLAKAAGIRIIMITGDNPITAKVIAKIVGIHEDKMIIVEGKYLENRTDEEIYTLLKRVSVVARATPEIKYKIVKVLQDKGEIVVVTGDGVNDAPAVKVADLGIAMGSGAQVTKESAKMVITDNNLAVIVNAIEEGRNITRNISKVICYLLSTNVFEIMYNGIALLLGMPFPLYGTQILWINLVTDGVQDKAFPFTKKEEELMKYSPKRAEKVFLGPSQIAKIIYNGTLTAIVHLYLFDYLLSFYPYEIALTISFCSAVASQWAIGIQEVKALPFFINPLNYINTNPYIFLGIFLGLILQGIVIYFVPEYFRAVPLKVEHIKWACISPIVVFLAIEIRKWTVFLLNKHINITF